MINFVENYNCSTAEKENATINKNLMSIVKKATHCLLLFPSDSIPYFFGKEDLSQSDALSFVGSIGNKLSGSEIEILTEEEDLFLGNAMATFCV